MKLLLDENLSPRLCQHLADLGLAVVHVREVGLASEDDDRIWAYAADHLAGAARGTWPRSRPRPPRY